MIETVFCIDIGTTSLKAGLISAAGEVVFICVRHFFNSSDRFIASFWKDALKSAVFEMNKTVDFSLYEICAISVSGNGPTVVLDSGLTFRWNENVSFLNKNYPFLKKEHSLFLPGILGMKLQFFEEFNLSKWIFSGPEFLIFELTGNAATILPNERFISAYWDSDLLLKYQIEEKKMPPFKKIAQICGYLNEKTSSELGLPQKIPVVGGGPDFVAALIGTKTLQSGKLCDRSGSSEGFNLATSAFIYDKKVRSLPSVIDNLWNISVLIPNSADLPQKQRFSEAKKSIEILKKLAEKNGILFPKKMTATGGQTKNLELLKQKSQILNMEIAVCQCADAEILGDACAGFVALKKYKNLAEAAENIITETVV